jgi:hypothetical protein
MGGVQTENNEATETAVTAGHTRDGSVLMALPAAAQTTAARLPGLPVCEAFSFAKITAGRKRHLPQFHLTETAGLYGTSDPTTL